MTWKILAGLALVALPLSVAAPVQAAATASCYVNDGYFVSQSSTEESSSFIVKRKTSADQALTCPLAAADADFVALEGVSDGLFFEDLLENHLVLLNAPAQVGDIVVVDLRDGKTIVNVSGTYDYTEDNQLHYWQRNDVEGTPEICPNYAEITQYGLAAGVLDEMVLDLTTGKSTATGETDCESLS